MRKLFVTRALNVALLFVITCSIISGKTGARSVMTNHRYENGNRKICSALDTRIVQEEWESVFSSRDGGVRRVILVNEMFRKMTESAAFQAHMYRLITDLNSIISLLHNEPALIAQLRHLAYKRNRYMGAHVAYYKALTGVMMTTLPRIANHFTVSAWDACLTHIGIELTSNRTPPTVTTNPTAE
ncbi:hypothetical protein LSH36_20g09024 [Paralvinella palmiformis]|uniref:Globin domain-containing protein n=1 Tax=Paralvinella palmiformis TaxID=53620 RepID=A0AAD9NFH6_9ANNE|nr:hypothetical protein LSH36_20g09024 [Paralvinella palmiformis]